MAQRVTVTQREGRLNRVPPTSTPKVELALHDNQQIVGFEMSKVMDYTAERKTDDWTWTAYIVTKETT